MNKRSLAPLLATFLVSCNYVGDRALDFLDQYRIAIGLGSVIGVRAKNLGLWDTGLMIGVKPKAAALGWKYGTPLYFNEADKRFDADQAEIIKTTSVIDMDYSKGSYFLGKNSAAILPALLSWVDSTPDDFEWRVPEEGDDYIDREWLWSAEAQQGVKYARVHAFDIEAEVGLLIYLDVGYSPGEFLDFFLGIVTIDIAGDDNRL